MVVTVGCVLHAQHLAFSVKCVVARMAVAYALINGIQLLQCVAPTPSERMCAVYSEPLDNLLVMDDYGRFEVSCLFYGSSDLIPAYQRNHIAQLVVDGQVLDLGKIPGGDVPAVVITRYFAEYPKSFEFRVLFSEGNARYSHPDEPLLVEELREVVLDDHLPMSAASRASVHNRVKDLELYARVMRNTTFKALIANNPERIMIEPLPNGPPLLVPTEVAPTVYGKAHELEEIRKVQEQRIITKLTEILTPGDLDFRNVFQHMTTLPEFRANLTGSPSVLCRFLLNRPDLFWFKQDAQHTTRVGLSSNHL
jgi:hypothetical protein